ncbi:MAG: hypothetical protein ACR2N4_19350 [Jatrophihabitans sp.]
MKRLLIGAGIGAAALIAAAPAVAGLAGNPSFSHDLPVRVPSQAQVVSFDDHGHQQVEHSTGRTASPTDTRTAVPTSRTTEPGDDHSGARSSTSTEPGDDHGGTRNSATPSVTRTAVPTSRTTEPGDDHGGTRSSTSTEPGDDHGGGGSGSGK